jgi:acyl dehydratase
LDSSSVFAWRSFVPAFETPDSLLSAQGQALGESPWLEITQERIQQFADATGDQQWIHVDVERAKTGPFGAPIAHGFLTLSLTSMFLPELLSVEKCSMGVNYGMNRVRFPSPVKVGARIRGVGKLLAAEEIKNGVQATIEITVEIEGESKPACVVEFLARYYR